jgi:2-amino-4-hydroxy-6-hydroxymethyldihydropteridine diphosphokinase
MSLAALSVGSNLGDRYANLVTVANGLSGALQAASGVYETEPWGGVEQGPYLNAVLVASVPGLEPAGWLARAQEFERAAGRVRDTRWGARTLDVDVLAVVDDDGKPVTSEDPDLTLPHPRAHERAFVLVPWAEIDPGAVLPGRGRVGELAAALPTAERAGVVRREELALPVRSPR